MRTILFELALLGAVYLMFRWMNARLEAQLAGAMPANGTTQEARTAAAAEESPLAGTTTSARAPSASLVCAGCGLAHEPPEHTPLLVCLYTPWAGGFVAHQFVMRRGLAAAHVALYRVPRFGEEARA